MSTRNKVNMVIYRPGQPFYKAKSHPFYEKKAQGDINQLIAGMMKRMITHAKEGTRNSVGIWTHIDFYDNHSASYPQPLLKRYVNNFGSPKLIHPKEEAHERGAYKPLASQ